MFGSQPKQNSPHVLLTQELPDWIYPSLHWHAPLGSTLAFPLHKEHLEVLVVQIKHKDPHAVLVKTQEFPD